MGLIYTAHCPWILRCQCIPQTLFSCFHSGWGGVLLAGGMSGMVGWSIGTPMDVIKARLQMDGARETRRYKGFYHCVRETARAEGVGVFFRSLGINCVRAFPVNMVVFATYELLTGLIRAGPASLK